MNAAVAAATKFVSGVNLAGEQADPQQIQSTSQRG